MEKMGKPETAQRLLFTTQNAEPAEKKVCKSCPSKEIQSLSSPRSPSARLGTASAASAVNDLLYYCREGSTNRPLFFQNKANLSGAQNKDKRSGRKGL
jgi:hypothetical protein